uniref:Retrovirus-related Pol polyprotein from transposon TNT 1-94 n=1 Tax=Tanacetum cinerariifolium TaxID=118510 RepID=A0A6L2LA90_TANCI|nr:retrovirus-related Pol polyprotein from transposon TNT 1-94 [Tanacetum cinerariifolium]
MKILIQTCLMPLAIKTQNDNFIYVHELKQEMHADLKYVESLEKEIDELESNKAEFSNIYDMILQECVSKDVMCSYLLSLSDLDALDELQCLYLHKVKESDCLAQKLSNQTESVNKKVHAELLQRFAKVEKHLISLEISLQKCKEQQDKNIAISELKKLIEKVKGKSVETKFDKPSVVRQPNAQRIPKPSVLATAQTLPQIARQAVSNINVLKPGMYRIDNMSTQTTAPQSPQTVRNTNPRMSTSTGVNHKTNVSRPRRRINQLKDKVVSNNSQMKLKKTQVEVHPRIPCVSNKIKSITTCKDSLNSRTLNANAVCTTRNKCLVDSNHFAYVTKMLNDVNARTKKPNVVPISTRKPKAHANKSVATPHKKKVALKSNNQKPHSYFRMLYKKTSKTWKWWIAQQSPSGYKWLPKTKMQWVPKAKKETVQKRVCFVVDNAFRITNIVQLILFIVNPGYTKHMTGNLKLLCNFVEKFLGFITSKASITISSQLVNFVMGIWRLLFGNLLVLLEIFRDETPEVLKEFLTMIQRNLQALVITVRTDRGTEFLNKTLNAFFKEEGIEHQTSTTQTLKQHGVVERQNRTLVEAARTMLSASKLPLFFWAEAITIACYTQNRSIIIPTHDKMAYHIINDRKPLIKHLHIFGCICYITRDGENLDKMKEKGDLCILVGYSNQSKGYHVYNKRTRMIVESIHILFDEIKEVSKTSVANDTSGLIPQ